MEWLSNLRIACSPHPQFPARVSAVSAYKQPPILCRKRNALWRLQVLATYSPNILTQGRLTNNPLFRSRGLTAFLSSSRSSVPAPTIIFTVRPSSVPYCILIISERTGGVGMSHNGPPARDQQTAHPNLLGAAPPPFLSLIATNFFLGTGSLYMSLEHLGS